MTLLELIINKGYLESSKPICDEYTLKTRTRYVVNSEKSTKLRELRIDIRREHLNKDYPKHEFNLVWIRDDYTCPEFGENSGSGWYQESDGITFWAENKQGIGDTRLTILDIQGLR